MSVFNKWNEYWVGRLSFPASNYLLNRRNIKSNFHMLSESEWFSQDRLRHIQTNNLLKTIKYASKVIPYYRNSFKEIGLQPEDIKSLEDLKLIPPLSRQDLIDHHKQMVDFRLNSSIPYADMANCDPGTPMLFARFRKHKLIRNTSSGSTGAPTVFYEDGSRTALNWALEMRHKSWFGVNPGAREARLVRLSVDYNPKDKTIFMRKRLWNQLLLPGTNLSDDDYRLSLDNILEFRPKVLWGFPSALAGLAQYILRTGTVLGDYRPVVAIGWAGPVYEHEEKAMKEALGCHVSNNYGAREVGHVAGTCPCGCFHINQETLVVESESNDGPGEILVTTIDPSPMPFIRYRMGDIGELEDSRCQCGRKLQVLKTFLGRTGEIFYTKDGHMISPNFWCRFFFAHKFSGAIRRFQIIYKKNKNLGIRIERGEDYTSDTETYIKKGVKENFSTDTKLDLEYVSKIEPQISGKYQMVINEASLTRHQA